MATVPVPELRRKFALVRAYSPRTSWELLAEPFGVAPKTVKYWGHGSATRAPDQIPAEALPVLVGLFAAILPGEPSADEARRLALGPASELEAVIRSGATASFAALLAREGQTGTAALFRKQEENTLIEIEGERTDAAKARLQLGELFRIEFPMAAACGHAVVLQGVQRAWAVVPSSIGSEPPPRRVLAPSLPSDPATSFMRERHDAGLHRFVCLQAAAPFPPLVDEHLRESVALDKRALDALAAFYQDLAAPRRSCHVLVVAIEAEPIP